MSQAHTEISPDTKLPRIARPPRWIFHSVLSILAVYVLWAASHPGSSALDLVLVVIAAAPMGILWIILALRYRSLPSEGHRAWFAVAPAGALVVALLLAFNAPLHFRWELSEGAFEDVVARSTATSESCVQIAIEVPDRIGLYWITNVYHAGVSTIFWEERGGDLLEAAGFIHVPADATLDDAQACFPGARFRALGGGWYSWRWKL